MAELASISAEDAEFRAAKLRNSQIGYAGTGWLVGSQIV